ncbi:hypothetical protein [Paenibacillus pini]|uniref:Uncharacterized protein n=1 Tax=Paenibacillus pini JCM 16418 TaxID=1236976 RepID=W7YVQ1_9BACL|nr:hypothetical protein [Paenibacillus pini]GAF08681.1 hypothetical protein JCM16418_2769 [Paenibacillus pini JCM 16418]
MSWSSKEHETKLALVSSIAQSQQALARILSSIADISAYSELSARNLQENIRLLSQYQGIMCEMLTGISLHRRIDGIPTSPWLNASHTAVLMPNRGVQEE